MLTATHFKMIASWEKWLKAEDINFYQPEIWKPFPLYDRCFHCGRECMEK